MRGVIQKMPRRTARRNRGKRKPDPAETPAQGANQAPPVSKSKAPWRMRSAQRLVRAIFAKNDPVEVATTLLHCKSEATRAKSFFDLLGYMYGKPAQQSEASATEGQRPFQFATYVPRPQYAVDPNSEDQRNKEACRQSLTGAPGAAHTNFGDVTQEDEND